MLLAYITVVMIVAEKPFFIFKLLVHILQIIRQPVGLEQFPTNHLLHFCRRTMRYHVIYLTATFLDIPHIPQRKAVLPSTSLHG